VIVLVSPLFSNEHRSVDLRIQLEKWKLNTGRLLCVSLAAMCNSCRLRLKCDGTRAETRFRLSAKRTSPFKSAGGGESVQSTTGSRGVRTNSSNVGYKMFRGSVKGSGYQLYSPVSPSLPFPCVSV